MRLLGPCRSCLPAQDRLSAARRQSGGRRSPGAYLYEGSVGEPHRDRRAGSAGWNFSNEGGSRPATALSQPSLAWGLDIQDSLFHLVRHGDLGIISVIIKNEHRIPFGGNL